MTLYAAYQKFLNYGSTYWAPRTKLYYEGNLSYFFRYLQDYHGWDWKDLELSDLPEDILAQYVVWLRSKTRYSGHPMEHSMTLQGSIKSNTVNTYMRAVKAMFNYFYNSRLTSVRFTEGLRLPRSDDDQIIPLLASEVACMDAVFDSALSNDLRNLCIIHLMLDAGLRSCEVVDLIPEDLIFSSHSIIVNRSKGNKSRVVIMCPSLALLLQEYLQRFSPSGSLFKKEAINRPIDSTVFRSLFIRLRNRTGISRLHPHLLRHTFATSYIMGGGNLETLRILMGHFDYSVTRKYLHLAAQYQILGADIYRLDPIFFKTAY